MRAPHAAGQIKRQNLCVFFFVFVFFISLKYEICRKKRSLKNLELRKRQRVPTSYTVVSEQKLGRRSGGRGWHTQVGNEATNEPILVS